MASRPGRGRGGGPGVELVRDLLRRAQEEARSGFFSGGGHTLGGEGSTNSYVPEDELAIRRLAVWRDGGRPAHMRYDDPASLCKCRKGPRTTTSPRPRSRTRARGIDWGRRRVRRALV
ncbi:hypothetical protein B0H14DRAFT_405768 [Mycena olivaceomarginata]|nr:hypothetical protein B0H14DRAFT_405768 [Mycena olivaceomarginata]